MSASKNRVTFEEFVPGKIWIQHIPFRFFGLDIGTRMTVVKLRNDILFIHSPTRLDEYTKGQLDTLGRVKYVVSPNDLHHFFIAEYFDKYPLADVYAPPGLPEKRSDLNFNYRLQDATEQEWSYELDQHLIIGDKTREIVFFHKSSKTLIVADLIMNFSGKGAFLTKLLTKVFGMHEKPFTPIDPESSEINKEQLRLSINRILEWNFDSIILAHGECIKEDGKKVLYNAFEWLY